VRRGRRASWYLWALERRINADCGERVLRWHEDIRAGALLLRIYRDHYWATAAVLWLVSMFSVWWGSAKWALVYLNPAWTCVLIGLPLGFGYVWKLRLLPRYDHDPGDEGLKL